MELFIDIIFLTGLVLTTAYGKTFFCKQKIDCSFMFSLFSKEIDLMLSYTAKLIGVLSL